MTHFAFVSPPFLGHVNPMTALAGELVGRGHRATFLHIADAEELVRGRGMEFRPVGAKSHPTGHLAGMRRRMARADTPIGLHGVIGDVAAATDMLCRELPEALRRIGADALVCDAAEAAGGLVAAHLGMPIVSVANALPLNREPAVPPPFVGWRYDPSPWGIERNRGGYRVSDWLMRRQRSVIAGHAEAWKLGPRRSIEDCLSPQAEISQLVPSLDFSRDTLPDTFHYCGPLRDAAPLTSGFAMPTRDGRPLGYASLGTLQGGRASLFGRIAEAAASEGVQLVLSHAGGLRPDQSEGLPGSPAVFEFVPQNLVLEGASVAILNGGLNTVLDALAAGVPAIVVPIAFEQGAIAARLERSGAGLKVSRRFFTSKRLATAIRAALEDPSYRGAAKRMKAEIQEAGGVRLAADLVEAVAATGRPVLRSARSAGSPTAAERAA